MAKLRQEGEIFDPLQGAPIDQITFDENSPRQEVQVVPSVADRLVGELGEAEGLYAVLENVSVAMLVADLAQQLVFANRAARGMLEGMGEALRSTLGVGVDGILGSSVRLFFDESVDLEKVMDNEGGAYTAKSDIGGVVIESTISRIEAGKGASLGYVVNLRDITEMDQVENEMARIKNMTEHAPTNLMMADKDLVITYINPAMRESLKRIENLLPVSIEHIVGTSLDRFHANPERQRAILKKPETLPHTAEFTIGDENVRLQLNPIFDRDGEYVGPMATWDFVTEKLRLEAEHDAAMQREMEQTGVLREGVEAMLDTVQAAADGDLTGRVVIRGDGAIAQIGEGLQRFFDELRQQITVISQTSQEMAKASNNLLEASELMGTNAEETSAQANTVSSSARVVSDSLQTTTTSIEEMSNSINEISTNTTKAAQMAQEAVSVTESTNLIVAKLGESSSEIGNVTKQISSIAEQTNLLALNATIEAARAGEAGKGFAVVANEVKELARETGDATEEIGTKIEAIQMEIGNAIEGISQVSNIIKEINDIQVVVSSAVEEQTMTSGEMAINIAQAAHGSLNITNNIEGVADAANNTASGAHDAQAAADNLGKMATSLQDLVARFKLGEVVESQDEESVGQLIKALEDAGYEREEILQALAETDA
ncbi:MAG: methyl-accepting chemotaxis protein [Candidatus Latescibacterota bacterium]|jgi:methyl-accepting chemotaxis protein